MPEEPTLDYGVHPITGVPLCRNVPRHVYKIPLEDIIAQRNKKKEKLEDDEVKKDELEPMVGDGGEPSTRTKAEDNIATVDLVVDISEVKSSLSLSMVFLFISFSLANQSLHPFNFSVSEIMAEPFIPPPQPPTSNPQSAAVILDRISV